MKEEIIELKLSDGQTHTASIKDIAVSLHISEKCFVGVL